MWPWKNKTGAGAEALVHDERHLSSCSLAQDMVLDSQTLLLRCVCVGGAGGAGERISVTPATQVPFMA